MKKRIYTLFVLLIVVFCLGACTKSGASSSFSIQFIDVGQGDSALVECDGHYMLVDGGDESAGDKVYDVLKERGVQRLDILAVSHQHKDHIGGLIKALSYASKIDLTISNSASGNTEVFRKFEHQLGINGSKISVPHIGDKFKLGSAEVEVIEVSAENDNDSLVLLVTYKNTRFLFTGDIGGIKQSDIVKKYMNGSDERFKINLIKMPHHGGHAEYLLIRTFKPDYAVISVGSGNQYDHPFPETVSMLDQADVKVYRTDQNGDITVKSDGEKLTIETSK